MSKLETCEDCWHFNRTVCKEISNRGSVCSLYTCSNFTNPVDMIDEYVFSSEFVPSCGGVITLGAIEAVLKKHGYNITFKLEDKDVDAASHGIIPQFRIEHKNRIYYIQYTGDSFSVIHEAEAPHFATQEQQLSVANQVMNIWRKYPVRITAENDVLRFWVGGYIRTINELVVFLKYSMVIMDRLISSYFEECNATL